MATKQTTIDGKIKEEINLLGKKKKKKSSNPKGKHPWKLSGNIKRKRYFEGRKQ